jgi:CubicO group peptidase (beta-lactamase class C family)/subtilisin-like proprotein convertase family protein
MNRHHWSYGARVRRTRVAVRPLRLEVLEDRTCPSTNPFNSSTFQAAVQQLMASNNLPQISIAAELGNVPYTYTYTNPNYTGFSAGSLPTTTANSLFRVASISKPMTAAAIMLLVQDGHLQLSDRAFQVLGFFNAQGNPVPLSGYDPVTGKAVTVLPSPALYGITIQSLLNMSSGLPQNMPVQSSTFPNAPNAPVIFTGGNYAALGFAGAFVSPPYQGPPASVYQQIRYYVYAFSKNQMSLTGPGTYAYSDTGYAILGAVAETLSEQLYGLSYPQYLQQYILGPMGISAPSANPAPGTPMVGLAHTLQSQAYPTEVAYYPNANESPTPSVFPNPTATAPPFTPSANVPEPYGGGIYYESHFGEEGMTATPLALVDFFNNLYAAYNGATTGPLSPATVQQMVSFANGTPTGSSSWYGLGWQMNAAPGTMTTPGPWSKPGSDPGTSSWVAQYTDGTTWAYVLNEDLNLAQGVGGQSFPTSLSQDVRSALYGTQIITIKGQVFTDANGSGVLDSGEAGQAGQIVYLDLNNDGKLDPGDPFTKTNANGNYSISRAPGIYTVREVVPAGYTQTTANPAPITEALSGTTVTGVNFGNFQLASVSGTAFMDNNANGVQDPGEPAVSGQTVFVDVNRNGVLGQGTVSVYASDPPRQLSGVGSVMSNLKSSGFLEPIQKITVGLNMTQTNSADVTIWLISPWGARTLLVYREGTSQIFSNTVLDDQAANPIGSGTSPFQGRYRPEQPLAALNGHNANGVWTLQILDSGANDTLLVRNWWITVTTAEPSTQTDANGHYSFVGLPPGFYSIRQVSPSNWVQTTQNPAGVTVSSSGANITGVNFGNFQTGTISGTVFNDLNGNGVQDPGEPGLSGRTLFLDQNQNGVPGPYTVTLASQGPPVPIPDVSTVTSGILAQGLVGTISKITVTLNINHTFDSDLILWLIGPSGTSVELDYRRGGGGANFTNTTFDDGASSPISAGLPPFTGTYRPEQRLAAFVGQNPNGTWMLQAADVEALDTGTILNWSITVTTSEPTAVTDANGNYTFTGLGPGTYTVAEVLPTGWTQTTTNPAPVAISSSGAAVAGVSFGEMQSGSSVPGAKQAVTAKNVSHETGPQPDPGLLTLDPETVDLFFTIEGQATQTPDPIRGARRL